MIGEITDGIRKVAWDFFIKRPMLWVYRISAILDGILYILVFGGIILNNKLMGIIILLIYMPLSVWCYYIGEKDTKVSFESGFRIDLIKVGENLSILKLYAFLSKDFCQIYFLIHGVYYLPCVSDTVKSYMFLATIFITVFVYMSKMLCYINHTPPVITALIFLIITVVLTEVGVERGFFNWTFISLVLISVIPNFFKLDTILTYTQKNINKATRNILEQKLNIWKIQIFLMIPFLYFGINFAEKIAYSEQFIFLWNFLMRSHIDIKNLDFLSLEKAYLAIFKTGIIVCTIMPFLAYRKNMIDYLIYRITKNSIKMFDNTDVKYIRVQFKQDRKTGKKKWKCIEQDTIVLPDSKIEKRVRQKTSEILYISGRDYVKSSSSILKEIEGKNKFQGKRLLHKLDYSACFFPVFLIFLVICGNYTHSQWVKNFKGTYVSTIFREGKWVQESPPKILDFKDEAIIYGTEEYLIDFSRMQITDRENKVVGSFEKNNIVKLEIHENKELVFIKE